MIESISRLVSNYKRFYTKIEDIKINLFCVYMYIYIIIRKIFEGRRRSFYRSVADCTWRENLKIDKRRQEAEEMETGREDSGGAKGKSFYE